MTTRSTMSGLTLALAVLLLPASASASDGWARAAGILRAGPSTDYPRVARVARGESLDVHGCLSRATWCDVSADGERGWLPGSRIEFQRDGHRQRLTGDMALFGLSILTFGRNDYWGEHYRGRAWTDDRRWNRDGDRTRPGRPPGAGMAPSDMQGLGPVGARPSDNKSDRRMLRPAQRAPEAASPADVLPRNRPAAPSRAEAPQRPAGAAPAGRQRVAPELIPNPQDQLGPVGGRN
jgi:uncharacterized protein YraI